MNTIDYVYRFDPHNPSTKPPPPDAEAARKSLEDGNRMFARWMSSCRTGTFTRGDEQCHVVQCNGLEVGMVRKEGGVPKQAPFAVVIGCSDARVPTEMLFGQGFNNLFVIRVAGNVLGDVCLGSVDFAVEALSESVKVLVVLGHSGCGAVTGAVDAYLRPLKYWSKTTTPALRSILQKIFVSVREGANALETVWGPDARGKPGFRDALIETAVGLNAAQAAFALRQEVEAAGRWEIEVIYGVYNLFNHQVTMPHNPFVAPSDKNVNLAHAPTNPREFTSLALQMAEILKPHQESTKPLETVEKEIVVQLSSSTAQSDGHPPHAAKVSEN
ncbi:MAG: carbonic anhydrase [Isosphaeraceae bacterium]|jgi:carbonic anhydrase